MPADWELPPGVTRGLWDYFHDADLARRYDAQLADTPLLQQDIAFVREQCPTPGRFVDLGCGTGRLAITLAQAGFQVEAVDLSSEMLAVLSEKARAAGVTVGCHNANLVELDGLPSGSFDAAACLFGTLGMIHGVDARRRFLGHVRRLLKPQGVFCLHVHNYWHHLWSRRGRRLLLTNLFGSEPAGDFFMPGHQGVGGWTMHCFSRREVVRELTAAGFAVRTIVPVGVAGRLGGLGTAWRAYGFLIAAACRLPFADK